jgi:hypothetical protein
MKPLLGMFQFAFACHHGQLSRPFTIKKRTYQVCLAGAQELEGSWAVTHSLRSNGPDHAFGSPARRQTRRSLGSVTASQARNLSLHM